MDPFIYSWQLGSVRAFFSTTSNMSSSSTLPAPFFIRVLQRSGPGRWCLSCGDSCVALTINGFCDDCADVEAEAVGDVICPQCHKFFTLENGCTDSEHRRIQINLRADRGSPLTEDDRDSYDGGYDTAVMAEVVDHLESVAGPRTCHGCHKEYLLKEADTGYMGNLCYECDPEDEPADGESVCDCNWLEACEKCRPYDEDADDRSVCKCADWRDEAEQRCDHCQRYLNDKAEYEIWCGVPEPSCSCDGSGRMCDFCAEEYEEPCRSCGVPSQLWTDEKHCRQCFVNLHGSEFPRRIELVD